MIDFSDSYLNSLINEAEQSPRLRQHRNIHSSYEDGCQRFMNAICVGSYICPHRHLQDPKNECLIAVKGLFALMVFNDSGRVEDIKIFGTEKYGTDSVGVELPAGTWHTVLALGKGSVLLEVKQGPFSPNQAKEFAPWAPSENDGGVIEYYDMLLGLCREKMKSINLLG